MKLAKLLIALTILSLAQSICASSVRVNSTGAARGTLNLCALRDKYGFLWVGTTTGLACFDGNGKPVNNMPSGILRATSNLRVNNIFEYGEDLLFATPNRLMKLDRGQKSTYRLPLRTNYGVEISSPVSNICNGPDSDDIWIATQGQGLFRYDAEKDELTQNSQHGSFFTDITLSDDGSIYAAEINGAIHKYKSTGEYEATYRIPGYIPNKAIINLVPTGDKIWIASGNNIYCLNTAMGSIEYKISTSSIISSIIKYDTNRLILGTASGVKEYDTAANILADLEVAENGLNANSNPINVKINQLAHDTASEGILAVRQSGEIVELFALDDKYRFVPVTQKFDQNKFVNVLTVDNRNNGLWVGADNGLYYYDISTGTLSSPAITGLGNGSITSITIDGDQVLIGTATDGLYVYNTTTGRSQHFKNDEDTPYSLISDEINNVFITTQGVTYVLTHWGICRYNPARNEFYTLPEVGQQTEVIAMAEYYDGGLWASTVKDGLMYMKPGESRFSYFNSRNLDNIPINKLMMSRNGTLWAATQTDGLYYYNKDTDDFEPYKLPLLTNRSILALQEDNNGSLWILTEESIIKISNDGQIDANYRNLLPSILAKPFALLESGDMAIGGNNGFQIFSSTLISQDKKVATYPTTISFPIEDSDKKVEELGLSVLLYTTDRITLPYDHNSFTLHLAANHSTDIPTVTYDYMLEGADKEWNIGTSQSEVTYNNLSPGTYRFMVRPSGFTDVETNALTITVSPPWYMSIWANIAYVILLLLLATGIWYLVRMRVRKHYSRRLASLKIQREREAWESKMRFFVDLVHEIRTPLMLIALPLEQLMKRIKGISADAEKQNDTDYLNRELGYSKKYLGSMQTNLDYLLGITNELLDFRKVDNGNSNNLYLTPCNLNNLIEEIRDRFEEPMETEGKRLTVSLPDNAVIADVDKVKIDRVLMNLIGNARKYCKSATEIKLEVQDGSVTITISDDGPGIPKEERRHIFNLYYQIKGDVVATELGTGLGLAYARLIARSHGGEITVGQSDAGGAQFRLRIPLTNESAVRTAEGVKDIYESGNPALSDAIAAGHPSTEDSEADNNPGESSTVLVVDDNKELLEMISDGLNGKYNVITASDGIDALEKLKTNDIDFIVSDVMMPRMNGMELLQKVKDNINTSHIPFIILTAKTTRESREEGMEHGADIYLEKPFSIRALIHQIENIRRTREYFYARRRGTEPLAIVEADEKEAIEGNKLPNMSKYDREFLERMETLMAENVSDDQFSIDVLAERLNMSRSSFYRKVKVLMGMTPVDYIKNYRLDIAAQQLRDKVRVNEVVANVGFTSHSYFAKCFKEKYGVLPRDYVG